jgi:SH3-like domain-containing protein
MKKTPYVLIALTIFLASFALLGITSAAEPTESVEASIVYPERENYYLFDSPTVIAADSDMYAVLDGNSIIVFGEETIEIPFLSPIKEMILSNGLLYVLTEDFDIRIYNTSDGSEVISGREAILSETEYPGSIAYDSENDILYVFGITSIEAFEVNTNAEISYLEEVTNISFVPQIVSSDDICYINGKLLILKIASRTLYSFDLVENTILTLISNVPSSAVNVYVNGNGIYLAELGGEETDSRISRYDLTGNNRTVLASAGTSGDTTLSEIGGISVNDNYMYVSDPSYSAVKIYTIASSELVFNHMVGSRGSAQTRLNSPSDGVFNNGDMYIADSMNDRVTKWEIVGEEVESEDVIGTPGIAEGQFIKPDIIAADHSGGIYVGDSTGRLQYFLNGTFIKSNEFDGIAAIAVSGEDKIYVAETGSKRIYSRNIGANSLTLFLSMGSIPLDIGFSDNGTILYILSEDGVSAFSENGELLPFSIDFEDFELTDALDIAIDYGGNVYILTDGDIPSLYRFKRNISSYELDYQYQIEESLGQISSMNLGADGAIYLTLKEMHCIAKIDSADTEAVTSSTPAYQAPAEIITPSRIAYVNSISTIYMTPDNYENVSVADSGECLIVLNEINYNSVYYYYVEDISGTRAYIRQSDTLLLNAGETAVQYVTSLHPHMDIYDYPSPYGTKIFSGIERGVNVEVISNVADLDGTQMWGWYEVSYSGQIGYVKKTEVLSVRILPEETITYSAKIKTPGLGEKVDLYALPDSHSTVIASLSDGIKVTLYEEINQDNEYTYIETDDYQGYIKTEYLTESGLTTGQILSIVLAAVTFIATAAVLLISRIIKKEYRN